MAKKAVTKPASTAVGPAFEYGEDEGRGYQHQTGDDIAMPFLAVLQPLSPQVVEEVEGAKAGKIFNTVTEEFYDEVLFVPGITQHVYVEWIPRDDGGGSGQGFVAVHQVNDEIVKKAVAASGSRFGVHKLENGNELVETFYMYGAQVSEDDEFKGFAILAFSSTFIKRYQNINTRLQSFTLKQPDGRKSKPPLFGHLLKVRTFLDSNSQYKWHNFDIVPAKENIMASLLDPNSESYKAGKQCEELIESGAGRADYATQNKAAAGDEEEPF